MTVDLHLIQDDLGISSERLTAGGAQVFLKNSPTWDKLIKCFTLKEYQPYIDMSNVLTLETMVWNNFSPSSTVYVD